MSVLDSLYAVKMPDGSKWALRVEVIANNRASYYKSEYGDDLSRSLEEDTLPLFNSDHSTISDWAKNNMNWSDVAEQMTMIEPPDIDFDDGWVNGDSEII